MVLTWNFTLVAAAAERGRHPVSTPERGLARREAKAAPVPAPAAPVPAAPVPAEPEAEEVMAQPLAETLKTMHLWLRLKWGQVGQFSLNQVTMVIDHF